MTHKVLKGKLALVGLLAGAFLIGGDIISEIEISKSFVFEIGKSFVFVNEAEARVGRPLTPVSVRGVARRTTRRVIRRTTIYVATLPPSCTQVTINSTYLHHCGNTYYQSSGDTYVVVNVE